MDKNALVTKSNKVVEASYKLNLNEQRILLSCISQHDSREPLSSETEFTLTAMDYSSLFGMELKNAYKEIKEGSDNLFERHLWIKNPDSGNPIKARWISSVEYEEGAGTIKLQFSQKIIPFLSGLSNQFTSYRIGNITKLTSVYAVRLYEMLLQWQSIGVVTFTMESFRESLGIKKDEYKRMFDFKRKVLNIAISQINEHTDINCYCEDTKKGRKITGFKFYFGKDCPTQIELEEAIAASGLDH